MAVHNQPPAPTVPEAVREILTRNYPVYQCLKMKLLNFHSVAELIQPQVQELNGRKTTINTIVVAIKRFSDTLVPQTFPDAVKALENARISLSSGITDVTIKARRPEFPRILKELTELGSGLSEFPNIFPLATSIKMIVPTEEYEMVQEKLGHLETTSTQRDVAKLSIILSPKAEKIPGIVSYITELFYRNGINIVDAVLGHGDIIMVLDGPDSHVAYEVLQREIHTSR
jgi:hypothetical protein